MNMQGNLFDSYITYARNLIPIPLMQLHGENANPEWFEAEVYSFPQTWGSTACGAGSIGGQAMTKAQTVVVYFPELVCAVVFVGRAYFVERTGEIFWNDVRNFRMAAAYEKSRYFKVEG